MTDQNALRSAAELLESAAIGDEGDARERTLVRLIQHAGGVPYADAGLIALHALRNSCPRSLGIDGDTLIGWEERVAEAVALLGITLPTGRPWTPNQRDGTRSTIHVKRCCNGCGELIGDIAEEEIACAVADQPLPDVRALCGCTPTERVTDQ